MKSFHLDLVLDEGAAPSLPEVPDGFRVLASSGRRKPFAAARHDRSFFALGAPVWKAGGMDALAEQVLAHGLSDGLLSELDGSFLFFLLDGRSREIFIAGDRFASIPCFYAAGRDGFKAALLYSRLRDEISAAGRWRPHQGAFFEFLHFQRILGDKTYDLESLFLGAATVLHYREGDPAPARRKYWRPDCRKSRSGLKDAAVELAGAVRASLVRHGRRFQRPGLLLSGGLDSRFTLAALDRVPICLTAGPGENNEFRVARSLARLRGAEHRLLARKPGHYAALLEPSVRSGGGMFSFDHSHMTGFEGELAAAADGMFHGYGLDFMFQGKYLPMTNVAPFGKFTYMKTLRGALRDLPEDYFANVPFRLKSVPALSLVRPQRREEMKSFALDSLRRLAREAESFRHEEYDVWEYFHMHNLSRHFTFPFLHSIRAAVDECTVIFDNALLDLYNRTPARWRLEARLFIRALGVLDPRFLEVVNANNNLPAGASPLKQTALSFTWRAARNLGWVNPSKLPPVQDDRSWPDPHALFRGQGELAVRGRALGDSEFLASLDFLDMDAVRALVSRHAAGAGQHGDALSALLTLDVFLKNSALTRQSAWA